MFINRKSPLVWLNSGLCAFLLWGVIALSVFCMSAQACSDEDVDLRLGEIKSIQVSLGMNWYPEAGITSDDLVSPFKTALIKQGIAIDQNNYDNVIGIHVDMAKKVVGNTTTYAVIMKFSYTEPCVTSRTHLAARCELWSDHEPLKIFTDPADIKKYVLEKVSAQADAFMSLFPKKQ